QDSNRTRIIHHPIVRRTMDEPASRSVLPLTVILFRRKRQSTMATTRRIFCSQAATLLVAPFVAPHALVSQTKASSRPEVAATDHDRILAQANAYLTEPPSPLTATPCARSPGTPHDYYSEGEDYWPDPANPTGSYILHSSGP